MADWNEQFEDDTPTFVLDVPVLNVDELDLEVNDLRAHVALRAELADFVKINVGVDVYLDKVKLNVQGLEAQALLKIEMDKVLGTLNRALEAIDKNPQILDRVVQDVDEAVGSAAGGLNQGAHDTAQDVDKTPRLEDPAGQAGEAIRQTDAPDPVTGETKQSADGSLDETVHKSDRAGDVTEYAPEESHESNGKKGGEAESTLAGLQIEEEYVNEQGQVIGRARDESGNMVEEVLSAEGDVLESGVSEEAEDREPETDAEGEVDATDAARRKADELDVRLSDVRGTGSGGRVLVKDVESAAKQRTADSV